MENIIDNQKSDNQKKEHCCNKKHCSVEKLSINDMTSIYLINSLSVIIEKGCGYQFLIYLNS